jgi:hypothetical protein
MQVCLWYICIPNFICLVPVVRLGNYLTFFMSSKHVIENIQVLITTIEFNKLMITCREKLLCLHCRYKHTH